MASIHQVLSRRGVDVPASIYASEVEDYLRQRVPKEPVPQVHKDRTSDLRLRLMTGVILPGRSKHALNP